MACCVSASCDHKWCRANAATWMPQVFDILDQRNPEVEVQLDALTPEFLPVILDDEHEDIVNECTARGVDGTFTSAGHFARPHIIVAGLYSKDKELDAATEEDWEQWKFTAVSRWRPTYMAFYPWGSKYIMSRMSTPSTLMVMPHDPAITREEAIDVAASLMTGSTPNFRSPKLFFSFSMRTKPWTGKKRGALAGLLNALTRRSPEDTCCWLTRAHTGPEEMQWQYPMLGPQQPAWVGAVHTVLGQHVWHSAMHCNIRISEERKKSPVYISIVTTW